MKSLSIVAFCFLFFSLTVSSQDLFTGKWTTSFSADNATINLTLEIGTSEKNILYPAQLTIAVDSFSGKYQLLLVRKTSRQLAISSQKFAVTEFPFSLGKKTWQFNGLLDFSKDNKGTPMLLHQRIKTEDRKIGIDMPEVKGYSKAHKQLATSLFSLFESDDLEFKKTGSAPWLDSTTAKILQPRVSPAYFGIIDTIYAKEKAATLQFKKNSDIDIITIKLNSANILEQIDSKKERDDEDIMLDTGLNVLLFFADDFGKSGGCSAAMDVNLGNYTKSLDFKLPENAGASFIVAKIFLKYDEGSATKFEKYNPDVIGDNPTSNSGTSNKPSSLNRPGKLIGSLVARSQQITFAIWDDAVEDGDTISLSINDKWITRNFPVLKRPQFITVPLEPGPNVITFVAENLGSIIPNTSVLEIIDGKKRQSFYIETDMNQNNQIKIFYDLKPE